MSREESIRDGRCPGLEHAKFYKTAGGPLPVRKLRRVNKYRVTATKQEVAGSSPAGRATLVANLQSLVFNRKGRNAERSTVQRPA